MSRPKNLPTDASLRLVGYVRVSTDEQARLGISLDQQEEAIVSWCAMKGHKLVRVYRDQGVSGTIEPHKRPGLAAALEDISVHSAQGIIFAKLDRLSRSVHHLLDLSRQAKKQSWHLASVYDPLDTTTAMGTFILHLLGALAELEVSRTSERVTYGMAHLKRHGRIVSQNAPFGFRLGTPDGPWRPALRTIDRDSKRPLGEPDKRPLVPCPAEQVLLSRIIARVDAGQTFYRVAKDLNTEKVPHPRGGKGWQLSSITAIYRTAKKRERTLAVAS